MKLLQKVTSELVDGYSDPLRADGPSRVSLQVMSAPSSFGAYLEGSVDGETWVNLGTIVSPTTTNLLASSSVTHVLGWVRVRFDLPAGATDPIIATVAVA